VIVEKKLHTVSIRQCTHQDLVQKSSLRRILFENKSALRCLFFIQNLTCGACFSYQIFFLIILGCNWFEVSYSVYKLKECENDSRGAFKRNASLDIIWITRRDRDGGEQRTWINRVSLKDMHVWGVNSTVTKHSHCFVRKDTSERVTQRCDDDVDKKRVNSCVLKLLLWRELSNQKNRQKTLENALSNAILMSHFQNFASDSSKGENGFLKAHFARF